MTPRQSDTTGFLKRYLWPLWIVLAASVSAREGPPVGVLVEAVTPNGAAHRLGLREGDLVRSWERGTAQGQIESPFDLMEVGIEQAPLGTVTLEGQRDGQELRWNMGPDEWGVRSRPILTQVLQRLYDEAREQDRSGAHVEAAQKWLAAAAESQDPVAPWLGPWFFLRAAESFAMAGQTKPSDQAYREAAGHAANSKPVVSVQLLQSWANASQQRKDWDAAQEHYEQSLTEGHKWNVDDLTLATSLEGLGSVFEQRDNFALAKDNYDRALAIREKLAPDSLPVASSLSDIGALSYKRGGLTHAEELTRRALAIRDRLEPQSLDVGASLEPVHSWSC